jgi:phosphohistidine phosphatase
MRAYLIRHAHALDGADDAARPLSKRGREQVYALARVLGKSGVFQPMALWHSPLVRSRQTAQLLARRAGFKIPLIEVAGLCPGDDPRFMARRINRLRQDVAIVGHEPHLSALGSLLVTGAAEPVVFVLKKCAALALERDDAQWMIRWHVSPEVLV